MAQRVLVRQRHENDLLPLSEVLRQVYAEDGYPVEGVEDAVGWLDSRLVIDAWTLEYEGQPRGHIALFRGEDSDSAVDLWRKKSGCELSDVATIGRLFVAPEVRCRGAGSLLVNAGETRARELGLRAVLDVMDKDRAAIKLYESRGWQMIGSFTHYFGEAQTIGGTAYVSPTA